MRIAYQLFSPTNKTFRYNFKKQKELNEQKVCT